MHYSLVIFLIILFIADFIITIGRPIYVTEDNRGLFYGLVRLLFTISFMIFVTLSYIKAKKQSLKCPEYEQIQGPVFKLKQ